MKGPKPRPAVDRILAKVKKLPCGCWIYAGALTRYGYARVTVGSMLDGTKRRAQAHREVYEALVGPIPDGLQLDHVKARGCVSRACCNPEHLEPVTSRENVLRSDSQMALRARQTHCKRGHVLAGENIYRQSARPNERVCRECHRAAAARRYAEKMARVVFVAAFSAGT